MDDVACPEASRCGLVSIGSRKLLCLDWRQRSTCVNTRRRGGAPLDARRPRCSLAGQVWVRCCAHIRDIAGASVSGAVHGPGDAQRWVLSTFRTRQDVNKSSTLNACTATLRTAVAARWMQPATVSPEVVDGRWQACGQLDEQRQKDQGADEA